jgi:hypothetical protein
MSSTATRGDQAQSTDDRSRVVAAACIGAVLGGLWGWLYLTSSGARARDRLDPIIDGAADALDKVQTFRSVSARVTALVVLFVAAMLMPQTAPSTIDRRVRSEYAANEDGDAKQPRYYAQRQQDDGRRHAESGHRHREPDHDRCGPAQRAGQE